MTDVTLPMALDAEASVLSACVFDTSGMTLDGVRALIDTPQHFYSRANKEIFQAICEVADAGQPIDIGPVAQRLQDKGRLQIVGGMDYLARLVECIPASANIEPYAEMVLEKSRLRQAIARMQELSAEARSDLGADGVQPFLEKAELTLGEIAHGRPAEHFTGFHPLMERVLESATQARTHKGELIGVPTGLDLDQHTKGLRDGDFRVVAGRPGMGKSAYVLCEALNMAALGYAAMLFSLEMPDLQLGFRALSIDARIDVNDIQAGKVDGDRWRRLLNSIDRLSKLPIWIDDTAGLTFPQLRARVTRLNKEIGAGKHSEVTQGRIGGVFVDYLQLMRSPLDGDRYATRENLVSAISRSFKEFALSSKLPITAVAQLNREVEKRAAKTPQLSDLRESGSIEQDADTIIFLHRPEYYLGDRCEDEDKGVCNVIVAKQRTGDTAIVRTAFKDVYTRFDRLAGSEYDDLYDP